VSTDLKDLAPILLPLRDEHGVELYYNVQVTPWCQITPDLQVISPSRERADTSLLVGLRAKIDF
jgi:porin